jgi:parvulin-like peptidyl-prolyl isomerase
MAKQPNPKILTKKHMARLERERIQQRYLIIGSGVVIVLVVGLILYGVLDQLVIQNLRPVARVAGETITTGEFQKEVRFDRHRSIQQLVSVASDQMMLQFFGSYIQQITSRLNAPLTMGQQVLDSMIEDVLVEKEAEKRGISISKEDLDREFEQAFGFYENGTPTPTTTATPFTFSTATYSPTQLALAPSTATPTATLEPTEAAAAEGTDAATPDPEITDTPAASPTPETTLTATPAASPTITLTPTITPTATPYTRELFEQEVDTYVENASNIDFSQADLRGFIRRQLLRRKVFEAVTTEVQPSGEFVWARHILVPDQESAQQVLDRLANGENFADLAVELSTDEGSRAAGGDLGWFTHGMMVEPFEEAAYALEIGQISEPVQSENGYHIIQLLGRETRPLDPQQLEQARNLAYQDWLEEAKAAADIETFDRWTSVVPSDPEIPAEIQALLNQMQQQQTP